MEVNENKIGQEEKRGRGRPRKYERDEQGKPILPPELDADGNPIPKRKRGRPRKEKTEQDMVPKVPKKRGRPRKNPVPVTGEADVAVVASAPVTEEVVVQKVEQPELVTKREVETSSKPTHENSIFSQIYNLFACMAGNKTRARYSHWFHQNPIAKLYRRRIRYTVVLITEGNGGKIRQFHLHDSIVTPSGLFLLVLLLMTFGISLLHGGELRYYRSHFASNEALVAELKDTNNKLDIENRALNDKVSVLSDTVNQKLEAEAVLQEQESEDCMPSGLPVDANAAIEERLDEQGEPVVIFTSSEGTSVIATGKGTVVGIEADAKYGTKLILDHGNGYHSIYRNAGNARVQVGDEITRGWILFDIGENNTALAYQVQEEESYVNPMEVIEING